MAVFFFNEKYPELAPGSRFYNSVLNVRSTLLSSQTPSHEIHVLMGSALFKFCVQMSSPKLLVFQA